MGSLLKLVHEPNDISIAVIKQLNIFQAQTILIDQKNASIINIWKLLQQFIGQICVPRTH